MVSCVVQQDSAAPVMRLYKNGVDDCPAMHDFIVGESEKLSIAVDVATADADFNLGETVKALADKKHKFADRPAGGVRGVRLPPGRQNAEGEDYAAGTAVCLGFKVILR